VLVCERARGLTEAPSVLARLMATVQRAGVSAAHRNGDAGLAAALGAASQVVIERQASPESVANAPSMLVVINEPERFGALRDFDEDLGDAEPSLGAILRVLLTDGPSVGVHLMIASASLDLLRTVLPDQTMQRTMRHRVVQRVSEDDSFVLVRSPHAARQAARGGVLASAVHFDAHHRTLTSFDPYLVDADNASSLSPTDLVELGSRLSFRRVTTA
jgi:hypothetical protein